MAHGARFASRREKCGASDLSGKNSNTGRLLTLIFSIWASWQLFLGPGTEQLTYGIIAPSASWAVLVSFAEKRARWLMVTAWAMLALLPSGDVEKALLPLFPAGVILLPLSVVCSRPGSFGTSTETCNGMKRYLAGAKLGGCQNTQFSPQEVAMNAQALGWDVHRKFSKVSLLELMPEGEIQAVERARLEHEDMRPCARGWLACPEMPVALEAAYGWPWIADLLEEMEHPPSGTPASHQGLGQNEAKADRIDADRLGSSNFAAFCRKLLGDAGSAAATGADSLSHGPVGVRTGVKNRIAGHPAPPGNPSSLQRPVRQGRPTFSRNLDLPEARGKIFTDISNCWTA